MTRLFLDIPGFAMFDATAIKVAQAHQNIRPFVCAETGREYMAHLRIETYHTTYRVPCETIQDARQWLDDIRALMTMASPVDDQAGTDGLQRLLRIAHNGERGAR